MFGSQKMQEELDKENEQFSAFRASVPLHRIKEPFVPEPPQHEPVVPEPFHLATAERAVKVCNGLAILDDHDSHWDTAAGTV